MINFMTTLSTKSKPRLITAKSVVFAVASLFVGLITTTSSQATTFTRTSLTSSGLLPSTVSEIGGVVVDLIGINGTRVVTQAAASGLYTGSFSTVNPITIGTQTGFSSTVIDALGGGISQAAVRISLQDGDSAAGNFDFNQNNLLLNNINFGNFSAVQTQNTDGNGVAIASSLRNGFGDGTLDTGFFFSNDATTLGQLYNSLSSGSIVFGLNDLSPGDQFYDFTQGLSSSVINVGSGPVVTPPTTPNASVPEPFTIVGTLMGGAAALRMRKRLKVTNKL
jgi:hypothetical protein